MSLQLNFETHNGPMEDYQSSRRQGRFDGEILDFRLDITIGSRSEFIREKNGHERAFIGRVGWVLPLKNCRFSIVAQLRQVAG